MEHHYCHCSQSASTSTSEVPSIERHRTESSASDLPTYATQNFPRLRNYRHNCQIWRRGRYWTTCYPFLLIFLLLPGLEGTLMSSELSSNSNSQQQNSNEFEQSIQWEEHPPPSDASDHLRPINTSYISYILNRLTDRSKYDKRLRPRYGEGAVDVGITIHVTSISAVSEVDMDISLDFYLRQTWYDQRLAFQQIDPVVARRIKKLTVGVDYLGKLWKPDTFFPNEKTSEFHVATTHNSFLRIEPDGRIYTSQRLTVKAMCQMELQLFPMDSQTCKLGLESYGYDVEDIDYYWGDRRSDGKRPEDAVQFDKFSLPQFRRTGYRVTGTHVTTSSGKYARLYFEVILSRNLGFYLMNIVVPSVLIVAISWVSFWLSREASPARVGLGVTTVLTMTTLITTTNNAMPKVSYIKGLDVFLNFCFIMVFAALVEFAIVSYWNKRQCRRRDRCRERTRSAPVGHGRSAAGQRSDSLATFAAHQQQMPSSEHPILMSYPTTPAGGLAVASPNTQSYVYRAPGLLVPASVNSTTTPSLSPAQQPATTATTTGTTTAVPVPPECDCRLGNIPLVQYNTAELQMDMQHHNSVPYMMAATAATSRKMSRRPRRRPFSYYGGMGSSGTSAAFLPSTSRRGWLCGLLRCRRLNPSKIDRLSRFCFPLLFVVFNLVYWSTMTLMSQRELEKVDFVPFAQ